MAGRRLSGHVEMRNESNAYVDALHAILLHCGWIGCSKPMLAGMTASQFRFTVNRRLTGESATAYNWMADHFLAADFIGITASSQAGFAFNATFPLYQRAAVEDMKRSIDRNIAALMWHDGFVVVCGYDDERRTLDVLNGRGADPVQLPYERFGMNGTPYWYYQVLESRILLDEVEIYRESLMQAIFKWEKHDLLLPEEQYACGSAAYDACIAALSYGDYDRAGWQATARTYSAARRDISLYMAELVRHLPKLAEAANLYARLAELFEGLAAEAEGAAQEMRDERAAADRQASLLQEAQRIEQRAIDELKAYMNETVRNRAHDVGLR